MLARLPIPASRLPQRLETPNRALSFFVGEEKKWDHVLFLGRGASKEQQNVSHQEKPTNKTEVQLRYTTFTSPQFHECIVASYRLNFMNVLRIFPLT